MVRRLDPAILADIVVLRKAQAQGAQSDTLRASDHVRRLQADRAQCQTQLDQAVANWSRVLNAGDINLSMIGFWKAKIAKARGQTARLDGDIAEAAELRAKALANWERAEARALAAMDLFSLAKKTERRRREESAAADAADRHLQYRSKL